jgi:uncharacterized membrane protein (DUF106 family)
MSGLEGSAMHGLVNDPYFVLLILFCAAVITVGATVTALSRIPRAEFAQLQNELKNLSERVRALEAAGERNFLRKLNSHSEGAEVKYITNGSGQLMESDKSRWHALQK